MRVFEPLRLCGEILNHREGAKTQRMMGISSQTKIGIAGMWQRESGAYPNCTNDNMQKAANLDFYVRIVYPDASQVGTDSRNQISLP